LGSQRLNWSSSSHVLLPSVELGFNILTEFLTISDDTGVLPGVDHVILGSFDLMDELHIVSLELINSSGSFFFNFI
tara:strand:- start:671 stop:898 length:228 start_codon:yes stop_codon:yes gene_type:complete